MTATLLTRSRRQRTRERDATEPAFFAVSGGKRFDAVLLPVVRSH